MEQKIKFFRKSVFVFFVLLLQAALIYTYYTQQSFLTNFKWDYIKQVYAPAIQYQWQNKSFFRNAENISQTQAAEPGTKAVPVLLYHGVVERKDGSNILVDDFRKQMMALKNAGYETVSLDDFHQFVKGKKTLPDKSFLLTFDDGRKDSYYPVDPLLKALDYKAVMFVITRYINAENDHFYLTKQELQKMLASGRWNLQAHTKDGHDMVNIGPNDQRGHYYTNKQWDIVNGLENDRDYEKRVFNDFIGARNDLEYSFGQRPIAFAFPFGDYGLNSVNYPKSKDKVLEITHYAYPISFYQVTLGNSYLYNYSGDDNYLYKRINVRPEWSPDDLLSILRAGQPKSLPFTDNFADFKGWFSPSGINEIRDNSLVLKASPDSSSGNIFLDGSKWWRDYNFESQIDWNGGSKLTVFAHYQDTGNYLACEIDEQYIQLVSEYDNGSQLLNEVQLTRAIPRTNLNVKMKVEGNKVICTVDKNINVEFTGIRDEQLAGGIGFRISDNQSGSGEIIIKNVAANDSEVIPSVGSGQLPRVSSGLGPEPLNPATAERDSQLGSKNNVTYNKNYELLNTIFRK